MRQFDVVKNANPATRATYPYLVVLQSDLLGDLTSRVVAPLVQASSLTRASVLNPLLSLPEGNFVLLVQQLAAVTLSSLKPPVVAHLSGCRAEILTALDRLFVGY